jgi:hypothetical protein
MRKTTAVWTVGLAASFVFAATVLLAQQSKRSAPNASATRTDATAVPPPLTPLNMKTGLWQTTMTGKYIGLPPQIASAMNATHTYKSCVKADDLTRNQWAKGLAGLKCSSVTVLSSTGTDTDVQAKGCDVGDRMTADGHGKFHLTDSGHLTGSMDVTFNGNSPFGSGPLQMHADYTSAWIGASCPADLN